MLSLLAVALSIVLPHPGFAYDFQNPYGIYDLTDSRNTINPSTHDVCAIDNTIARSQNLKNFGLTKRVVLCVKESVVSAVYNVLVPFSNFFSRVIAVMCTLAIAIWGIQVTAGRRHAPSREAFLLAVKIGAVIMFTANFGSAFFDPANRHGGFFGLMLDALEDLLGFVAGYVTFNSSLQCNALRFDNVNGVWVDALTGNSVLVIWDTIDCALDMLVGGIFSPLTLSSGIIGFLIAALVSNVIGFFIALLGFAVIAMLLFAIARAVYIFITAYIAFALMVLISPLFIPMILFNGTKAYFEKWLRLTIGFILQPIFTFVFLAMLFAAFDVTLFTGQRSLYRSIIGDSYADSRFATDSNFLTFNHFLQNWGAYHTVEKAETAANLNYDHLPGSCEDTSSVCSVTNTINKLDTGILATTAEEGITRTSNWRQEIYDALGARNIFKGGIPLRSIDWEWLAVASKLNFDDFTPFQDATNAYGSYLICLNNPTCGNNPDPDNYLTTYFYPYMIQLVLACIMAVVTIFIFMSMLEYLPFIGSGIAGEVLSLPTFGAGRFAPPGSGMMGNIQKKLSANFLGGG